MSPPTRRSAIAISIVLAAGLLHPASGFSQEATIDTVVVERADLFSDEQAAENSFFSFFNEIHATTKPWVIRREVLLEAGQPYDSLLAAESERNLRRLNIFRSVRVDTSTVDGRRTLFVRTRDAWSLRPRTTLSIASDGRLTGTFGVTEQNVGGTGNQVRLWYIRRADRDGINVSASSNRIGNSQLAARISWFNLSDSNIGSWSLSRPLRSFSDRWSVFYEGRTFSGRVLQFRANSPVAADTTEWRRRAFINSAFLTYAPVASAREFVRVGASVEVRREEYLAVTNPALDLDSIFEAVPDTVYGLVGGFIEYRRARFARVRNFNGFPEEDQDLSDAVFLSLKLAHDGLGYSSTGVGARIRLASGVPLGRGVLKGVIDGNGLFNSAGLDSGRVVATGTFGISSGDRNATFLQVAGGALEGPAPGQEFDLGFELQPRLWGPHAFVGTRSFRATIEHRYFAFPSLLDIVGIGFGAFVDYGGAWFPDQDSRLGGNTGVALFFGSPLGSFAQVGHISAGYRFGGGISDTDDKRWVVTLGSGIIF